MPCIKKIREKYVNNQNSDVYANSESLCEDGEKLMGYYIWKQRYEPQKVFQMSLLPSWTLYSSGIARGQYQAVLLTVAHGHGLWTGPVGMASRGGLWAWPMGKDVQRGKKYQCTALFLKDCDFRILWWKI